MTTLTAEDISTRRLKVCVEKWPDCASGEYRPECCRFPKSCSPYGSMESAQSGLLTDEDLEPKKGVFQQPPDDRFLRNIHKPEFTWTFQLIGRRNVTGRVIHFIWDSRGEPITLMIQPPQGRPFEIPWSSIQTIQQGKGN